MSTVHIAGHLGRDPEKRVTPSGLKVTTLTIATNIYQNGKDETVWWRVTCWGDEFTKIIDHLKKGSGVMIVGEMKKPEIYTDKEGKPQISLNLTALSIRFNPFGKSDRQGQEQRPGGTQANTNGYAQQYAGGHDNEVREPNFASPSSSPYSGGGYSSASNNEEEMPF